jgi:hypothetical protein
MRAILERLLDHFGIEVSDRPLKPRSKNVVQGETRKTKRVRLFTEFIPERLRSHAGALAGELSRQNRSDGRPEIGLQNT